jgi:nucleotide-binding universal stress UspA family protein
MTAQRPVVIREIMAATDFSEPSERAFDAALALAEHFGARLHVCHAARNPSGRRLAEANLQSLTERGSTGIQIIGVVQVGPASAEIIKYAERERIDLIILGTHGRTGLAHVLIGSVAEAVVRSAPCQVLTIGPKAEAKKETVAPVEPVPAAESRCLVCAQPSVQTICEPCKAHIRGEAIERKRREEKPGRQGLPM